MMFIVGLAKSCWPTLLVRCKLEPVFGVSGALSGAAGASALPVSAIKAIAFVYHESWRAEEGRRVIDHT